MPAQGFPLIRHIDDVLPAIAGRQEFIVARRDGYTVIDYGYQLSDTFGSLADPDPGARLTAMLRREARGLKFAGNGRLLARAWPKFFNLGEKDEVQPHRIDWSQAHWVLEKLDGSMVHPAVLPGGFAMMTMMGVTPVADQALRFTAASGLPYEAMSRALIAEGVLPIFEWCSRQQRIVVDYPEDRLVMTGARSQEDGAILGYPEVRAIAGRWGIPVVPAWEGGSVSDPAAFVASAKSLREAEGYVVLFASGLMLKVKADDYVTKHAAKEGLSLEKNALSLVLSGKEDDVMPLLPGGDRDALARFASAVRTAVADRGGRLGEAIRLGLATTGGDRKRFATEVVPTLDRRLRGLAFGVAFEGVGPVDALAGLLLKECQSGSRVEAVRDLMAGLRWQDFT